MTMIPQSSSNKTIIGDYQGMKCAINCTQDAEIFMQIDKITLTTSGYSADKKQWMLSAADDLLDTNWGQPLKLRNGYRQSARVFPAKTIEPIYFSWDPYHENAAFFRLEFNPAKMGPAAVENLINHAVEPLLQHGVAEFHSKAKLSRVDIAIDVIGIPISRLLVVSSYAVRSTKIDRFGNLETIYLGDSASQAQTRIYDKLAEMISKGKVLEHQLPVTRIERVSRNGPYLKNLMQMKNPLASLKFGLIGKPPQHLAEHEYDMFLALGRELTPQGALMKIPKAKRSIYAKEIASMQPESLTAQSLWKHWPKVAVSSGLDIKSGYGFAG
jgi:hypothetical protein